MNIITEERWDNFQESASGMINTTLLMSANDTLTCAARELQRPIKLPYSPVIAAIMRSFNITYYLLLMVAGISLHTLLFGLVCKFKQLQTLSFVIALKVVAIDFINASIVMPVRFITAVADWWLFGANFCIAQGYLTLICNYSRTLLMLVLVTDRFLTVFLPYFYPKHRKKIVVCLSLLSWVFTIISSSLSLPWILDCFAFQPVGNYCVPITICGKQCKLILYIITSTIYVPSCIIPLILYGALYIKAKKFRDSTPLPADADSAPQREWRATITYFLMFVGRFITIFPFFISYIVSTSSTARGPSVVLLILINIFSNLFALLTVLDPIFIMRDRDVRTVLSKVKCKIKRKCQVHPETQATQSTDAESHHTHEDIEED